MNDVRANKKKRRKWEDNIGMREVYQKKKTVEYSQKSKHQPREKNRSEIQYLKPLNNLSTHMDTSIYTQRERMIRYGVSFPYLTAYPEEKKKKYLASLFSFSFFDFFSLFFRREQTTHTPHTSARKEKNCVNGCMDSDASASTVWNSERISED